jgi:hypothetical protein
MRRVVTRRRWQLDVGRLKLRRSTWNNQQRIQAPLRQAELEFFVDCSQLLNFDVLASPFTSAHPRVRSRQQPQHTHATTMPARNIEEHGSRIK